MFLAQRYVMGYEKIVGLLDIIVRVMLCYFVSTQITGLQAPSGQVELGKGWSKMLQNRVISARYDDVRKVYKEWCWLIGATISISLCHIYNLCKGYE